MPAIAAGRHDMAARTSASVRTPGSTSSVTARARAVSQAEHPAGRLVERRSFTSGVWGAWSVAMASMVPSARPAFTAATSASPRSGGFTLNTGS